jgi:hypothetical protein
MKFIKATELHRKSGGMGHPALVVRKRIGTSPVVTTKATPGH